MNVDLIIVPALSIWALIGFVATLVTCKHLEKIAPYKKLGDIKKYKIAIVCFILGPIMWIVAIGYFFYVAVTRLSAWLIR